MEYSVYNILKNGGISEAYSNDSKSDKDMTREADQIIEMLSSLDNKYFTDDNISKLKDIKDPAEKFEQCVAFLDGISITHGDQILHELGASMLENEKPNEKLRKWVYRQTKKYTEDNLTYNFTYNITYSDALEAVEKRRGNSKMSEEYLTFMWVNINRIHGSDTALTNWYVDRLNIPDKLKTKLGKGVGSLLAVLGIFFIIIPLMIFATWIWAIIALSSNWSRLGVVWKFFGILGIFPGIPAGPIGTLFIVYAFRSKGLSPLVTIDKPLIG